MNDGNNREINWIAVDWGTSALRVWAMSANGTVIERRDSNRGMSVLEPAEFEPSLRALIDDFLPDERELPIVACGMVGAQNGWIEASYQSVPCGPPTIEQAARPANTELDVYIIPGLKQIEPPDVMRGEETQVAGFLNQHPDYDGVICLPGTHTKWVRVSAGEIVSFKTFMTGELFALLSTRSVLRHSVDKSNLDKLAFSDAVNEAMTSPQDVAAGLFSIRAGSLLGDLKPVIARSKLSGLLIGLELAAAEPYWLGRKVVIIGAEELADLYQSGLQLRGLMVAVADGEDVILRGLTAAYRGLGEVRF
jgi:2-dehydro-3-deoxygalactonokinase